MTKFEVVNRPIPYGNSNRWKELYVALSALPDGKSIRLPSDIFKGRTPSTQLRHPSGRTIHYRTLPDGVYLWLEEASEAKS